ncbi:hypothetical protein ADK55_19195 [Streptomyces sp. WM4235]|uniref:hypothetical protein n=1 Tax=Streptomyces sp. WM4235 TaxID=1415551 RepID=UPI0006B0317E|nr:hypothetical protein [Streptomyces sp. WM4235]KOU48994.1 hypothetical protein ADK55_19195 [Streptomyces sp. WM4235]
MTGIRLSLAELRRRLALGNGLLLESPSRWFDVPTLGGLALRIAVPLGGGVFYGLLLGRAPQFIYAVPPAWLAAVWWLSDSSATPPPLPPAPSGDVFADDTVVVDRVERGPEGVVFIIHPVRQEVKRP